MRIQTFSAEPTIERLDEGIVGRLPRPREVECHAALIRPQIQIAGYKLSAEIDTDRRRQSHFSPDSFQHLDDIGAAETKTRLQRWREA